MHPQQPDSQTPLTPELVELYVALAEADPAQWSGLLNQRGIVDPTLRDAALSLLKADRSPAADVLDRLVEHPPVDLDAILADSQDGLGLPDSTWPRIGPKYAIVRPIGFGAHGDVYLARQSHPIERTVAIKVLRPSQVRPSTVERMAREAKAMATLNHPNISTVFEAGQTVDGRPFIATEFVPGEPIDRWCETTNATAKPRCHALALVCRAVEHMHQRGIIHRDLKPTNILVAGTPEDPRPKILDLGIAKMVGHDGHAPPTITREGALLGSLGFIAPEQFGGAPADTRSDIYALGRVLEEMLDVPEDPWLRHHARDTAAIVRQATQTEPVRRYASAGDMASDLEALVAGRPISARRLSKTETLLRVMRQNKAATALSVFAMASALTTIATLSHSTHQLNQTNQLQKAAIKDTLDGLVLYLGRYGGTHDQRTQLVATMHRQIAPLLANSPDDPDLRILHARLLVEEARIHIGQLEFERAMPLADRAVEIMDALVNEKHSSEELLDHLALALIIRGDIDYDLENYDSSRRVYERVLRMQEAATVRFPESIDLRHDLTWSYDRLTVPKWLELHPASKPEMLERANRRLAISQDLFDQQPNSDLARYTLAMAHFRLGVVHSSAEPAWAMQRFEEAIGHLAPLVEAQPQRGSFVINLADAWRFVSMCADELGLGEQGLTAAERSFAILERYCLDLASRDEYTTKIARDFAAGLARQYDALGQVDRRRALDSRLDKLEAHVNGL